MDFPKHDMYLVDRGYETTVKKTWMQSSASPWIYNVPWGLRSLMKWIRDRYNAPDMFVTENGWSDDGTSLDDPERIIYLKGHFCNLYHAINTDNISVIGHTLWSSMDNWEWSGGYRAKFGILSVNFTDPNRKRTPKFSYHWYKNVVASKCVENDEICVNSLKEDW